MKNKAFILVAFGTCLMASILLNSCSTTPVNEPPTLNESAQTESAEDAAVVEEALSVSELVTKTFSGHDFEGYDFRILAMDPGKHFYYMIGPDANEVYYEEDSADILNSAIYKRNLMTEELLNVHISPVWGGDRKEICPLASNLIFAGDDAFDCMLAPLYNSMPLAQEHQLINLNSIDTLNTDNLWWDQDIITNFSVNDKLFLLAGHYNIFDDYGLPVIFVNKQVIADMNFDNPYEIIESGAWTLEYMMSNAEAFVNDLNGDGKMTIEDDQWGYLDNGGAFPHLAGGMGFNYAEKDADGIYRLTLGSEYVVNAAELIYNSVVMSDAFLITGNAKALPCFQDNRALYYYELLGAINELRDMESDFGVAPIPKYNEAQSRYCGPLQTQWCTGLSVPVIQCDLDRTGTVLDVLGGYSTDTVQATLFDLVLGSKLVRDAESVNMLDIVFHSKMYDLGSIPCETVVQELFKSMGDQNGFQFASKYESQRQLLEQQLSDFFACFEDE